MPFVQRVQTLKKLAFLPAMEALYLSIRDPYKLLEVSGTWNDQDSYYHWLFSWCDRYLSNGIEYGYESLWWKFSQMNDEERMFYYDFNTRHGFERLLSIEDEIIKNK